MPNEVGAEVAPALTRNVKGIVWFPQLFGPFRYDALGAAQKPTEGEQKRLATPRTPEPVDPGGRFGSAGVGVGWRSA